MKTIRWLAIAIAVGAIACRASISQDHGDAGSQNEAGPAGICKSTSDCAESEYCDLSGRCAGEGICKAIPSGCPVGGEPVCSCGGVDEDDPCLAPYFEKVGVAYGGECRNKIIKACSAAGDCASDEVCAIDSQSCDGGNACSGFCFTATDFYGGPFQCGNGNGCATDNTSTCAQTACLDGGAFRCDYCVFSSGLNCDASSDCPSGQVCLTPAACNTSGACPRTCVVP